MASRLFDERIFIDCSSSRFSLGAPAMKANMGSRLGPSELAEPAARLDHPNRPPKVLQKVLQSPGVAEMSAKKKALNHCSVGLYMSAPHWTRTNNPLIKSQMLCQLS